MKTFVNLTPHVVVFQFTDNRRMEFPPSGNIATVATDYEDMPDLDGMTVKRAKSGQIKNLPDPQPNTYYIVSMPTAMAARREVVICPDTGSTAVRNQGFIQAVTRWNTYAPETETETPTAPLSDVNLFKAWMKAVDDHMSVARLQDICYVLGIDYANLPGNSRRGKGVELYSHLHKRGLHRRLVEYIK